jgi:uncharacterized membrane protein YphA (DoxX/SURF4 family)
MQPIENVIIPHAYNIGFYMLMAVFLLGGTLNLISWDKAKRFVESKNVPFDSSLVVIVSSLWQISGAVMAMFSEYRIYGCISLIAFTFVSSIIFYQFWKMTGLERHVNQILFLANIGVIGGLYLLIHHFGTLPHVL